MLDKIYDNVFAFNEMVKLTLLLSNSSSPEYDEDAGTIIGFIGHAFELDDKLIDYCKKQILEELISISTVKDSNTYARLIHTGKPGFDIGNPLLSVKAKAINDFYRMGERSQEHPTKLKGSYFDYNIINSYNAKLRFFELDESCQTGNVDVNLLVGILDYLGIGTKKNPDSAIRKLKQCLCWGSVSAVKYLSYIYMLEKDGENAGIYNELFQLREFINLGITVLPDEVNKKCSKKVKELFAIITSIKHDIIHGPHYKTNIDFSFVEVMLSEKTPYHKKLRYINNYDKREWLDETNSPYVTPISMGFKTGDEE